jgi:benzylsuccinate CoA-transferase BbsF subunit
MAPHSVYRCKGNDRWVSIAVAGDEEWANLCKAMGDPDWTRDARFATAYGRWEHQERLDGLIEQWTLGLGHYELMALLQKYGVAAMPSFKAKDLFSDPHLVERGGIVEVQHPQLGTRKTIAPPWKMSQTPPAISRTAPQLGEHNQYVLHELLGIAQDELDQLIEEKIVY